MSVSATRASSATCARICLAPNAQLKPIDSGVAWATEFQNASGVCPANSRPDRSVIVPEIISGSCRPRSSMTSVQAKIAAFALSVSKMVSISNTSTPPSISPRACSV